MTRKLLAPLKSSLAIALLVGAFLPVDDALAAEAVLPAVDGMVIDTKDNVLQQVKIRLKSFGPGICAVRVIFAGKIHMLQAPPLTWSSWMPIGPAVNGGAFDLAFSPECDVGALGEVKFEK